MFLFVGSFVAGMIISLLTVYLSFRYYSTEDDDTTKEKIVILVRAAVFLVVPMLANYLPTSSATPVAVAVLLGLLIITLMGYMVYWWNKEGSSIRELIATIVIDIFLAIIGNTTFARLYDLNWPRGAIGFMMSLPLVVMIISIGYCMVNMIWWHTIEKERMKKEGTVGTTTPILDALKKKFERGEEDEDEEFDEFDEFEQKI